MIRVSSLSIIALVAALSACGVEPARGPASGDDPGSLQVDQQAVTSDDPADPASNGSPSADVITPQANGCSFVDWCDVPSNLPNGSFEGTRCVQAGCSVQSAVSECKSETKTVCGTPVPTWVFVTSNGVHHPASQSCILSNRCGNFTPGATCQCDSACALPQFQDCCFDGPC